MAGFSSFARFKLKLLGQNINRAKITSKKVEKFLKPSKRSRLSPTTKLNIGTASLLALLLGVKSNFPGLLGLRRQARQKKLARLNKLRLKKKNKNKLKKVTRR